MKVAVSIPDDVFAQADRLAEATGSTRSAIYARALTAYVRSQSSEQVTEALDAVVGMVGGNGDDFTDAAARRTLARSEW